MQQLSPSWRCCREAWLATGESERGRVRRMFWAALSMKLGLACLFLVNLYRDTRKAIEVVDPRPAFIHILHALDAIYDALSAISNIQSVLVFFARWTKQAPATMYQADVYFWTFSTQRTTWVIWKLIFKAKQTRLFSSSVEGHNFRGNDFRDVCGFDGVQVLRAAFISTSHARMVPLIMLARPTRHGSTYARMLCFRGRRTEAHIDFGVFILSNVRSTILVGRRRTTPAEILYQYPRAQTPPLIISMQLYLDVEHDFSQEQCGTIRHRQGEGRISFPQAYCDTWAPACSIVAVFCEGPRATDSLAVMLVFLESDGGAGYEWSDAGALEEERRAAQHSWGSLKFLEVWRCSKVVVRKNGKCSGHLIYPPKRTDTAAHDANLLWFRDSLFGKRLLLATLHEQAIFLACCNTLFKHLSAYLWVYVTMLMLWFRFAHGRLNDSDVFGFEDRARNEHMKTYSFTFQKRNRAAHITGRSHSFGEEREVWCLWKGRIANIESAFISWWRDHCSSWHIFRRVLELHTIVVQNYFQNS
jgi:hypothetical protein